jgi:hypothetical protein
LLSQRAKAVKEPEAPGLAKALPVAVQALFCDGNEVVVQERSPVLGGMKLGETAKPPPEAWVLPWQTAVAVAVPPAVRPVNAVRVVAGVFPFFLASASAGVRPARATRAARPSATVAQRNSLG